VQEAADAAAAEVTTLRRRIADAEEAATQHDAAAAEMRSLQEKTAADALAVQQKLESEFLTQCDQIQELQKSLDEVSQRLKLSVLDASAAQLTIEELEADLQSMLSVPRLCA
jgi:hypothetical protein